MRSQLLAMMFWKISCNFIFKITTLLKSLFKPSIVQNFIQIMQLEYVKYSLEELEDVKNIFIEYSEFLQVDLCFQDFEKELMTLHEVYSPPRGCIILAKQNDKTVGCIALKPISNGICEMKRLYVRPQARGTGLGRKLVEELIIFAQKSSYQCMKLDTVSKLKEAIHLYRSLGFTETTPYVYNPLADVLYFELKL